MISMISAWSPRYPHGLLFSTDPPPHSLPTSRLTPPPPQKLTPTSHLLPPTSYLPSRKLTPTSHLPPLTSHLPPPNPKTHPYLPPQPQNSPLPPTSQPRLSRAGAPAASTQAIHASLVSARELNAKAAHLGEKHSALETERLKASLPIPVPITHTRTPTHTPTPIHLYPYPDTNAHQD